MARTTTSPSQQLTAFDAQRLAELGRHLLSATGAPLEWHGTAMTTEGRIEVEGLCWERLGSEVSVFLPIAGARGTESREIVCGFLALLVYASEDASGSLQWLPGAILAYLEQHQPRAHGWVPRLCGQAGRHVRADRKHTRGLLRGITDSEADRTTSLLADLFVKTTLTWLTWPSWMGHRARMR